MVKHEINRGFIDNVEFLFRKFSIGVEIRKTGSRSAFRVVIFVLKSNGRIRRAFLDLRTTNTFNNAL